MKEKGVWSADFGNDPYDDYNLIVEILYNEKDVGNHSEIWWPVNSPMVCERL